MAEPQFRWEENTVIASLEGSDVGRITVPHVSLQFPTGVWAPLAGISGVGVDESARRRGIANAMMQHVVQFARDGGYTCSGVATAHDNQARRLYARAGYVHLFTQYSYSGPLGELPEEAPQCSAAVRPFCADDEDAVLAFVRQVELSYFGTRARVIELCGRHMGYVAEQNGEIIGSCSCFPLRLGLEANLFVAGPQRLAVAGALLKALIARVLESGQTELHFSIPQDDQPLAHLLWQYGFRPQPAHVFMFNILDLQGLLELLLPLFERRTDGIDSSTVPEQFVVRSTDQTGTLMLGGSAAPVTIAGSRRVITRLLCGTISAWEAYLCGYLAVEPEPTEQIVRVLKILLPTVPYHHPGTDKW